MHPFFTAAWAKNTWHTKAKNNLELLSITKPDLVLHLGHGRCSETTGVIRSITYLGGIKLDANVAGDFEGFPL